MFQFDNGGIILFPPDIWKFHYKFNYEELKPKVDHLFKVVEKNSKLEEGDATSTVSLEDYLQPHTWLELADFQNWLGEKIAIIRRCHEFTYTRSEVTNSWLNRHFEGGITLEHNHNASTFVVASYLKLPANSGFIEFKDPLEYHKTMFPILPEESLYKAVPCETNDVLIFPGYMRHRVQPNLTNNERLVMTFNVK